MNINHKLLYQPQGMIPPAEIEDAARYICHRIFVGKALWATAAGYTKLKAAYLKEMVGDKYHRAMEWLQTNHWVETDNNYAVGVKSKGYRWLTDRACRVQSSPFLSTKINARSRKTFKQFNKAHKHLVKWLSRFAIDRDAAREYVLSLKQDGAESCLTDAQFQESVLATVDLIADGEWDTKVCDWGRFHSPYTRLLKELRGYVTYEGMSLVNVDIANSQPLMLCALLPFPCSFSPPIAPPNSLPIPPSQPHTSLYDSEASSKTHISEPHISNNENGQSGRNDDIQRYRIQCETGTFYYDFMKLMGYTNKRLFKDHFFERVIFSTGKKDCEMAQVFRREYPSVWEIIQNEKRKDHRDLPCKMQRAESRVIIDGVVGTLAEEYPDVPVITIHDSIMTTPSHVPIVKRLIAEEFAKIGLHPTIREEDCK